MSETLVATPLMGERRVAGAMLRLLPEASIAEWSQLEAVHEDVDTLAGQPTCLSALMVACLVYLYVCSSVCMSVCQSEKE